MPELPEVETVLRTLEQEIKGEPITYVNVFLPKMIDRPEEDFRDALDLDMTVDLGENMRDQLSNVFDILISNGIDLL